MEKLRVDTGIRTIEVNDDGEYISVNLSDNTLFDRYRKMMSAINKKGEEIDKRVAELEEKYGADVLTRNSSEENDTEEEEKELSDAEKDAVMEAVSEYLVFYKEVCDWTCAELDKFFGEGCCRKVFPGVESPGLELICDFLDAVMKPMRKFAAERGERIDAKYNNRRKGANSR